MADIIIKGMEMPTRCGLCPMFCDDINDYCSAAQRSIPFDAEKPEWCPLVPLPEGHGRLIDGDVMVEGLMKCAKNPPGDDLESRWFYLFAAEIAKSCPTIVPAEGGTDNG